MKSLQRIAVSIALAVTLAGAGAAQAQGGHAALIADMQAKASDCQAIAPRTKPAVKCISACRASARTLENSPGLSPDMTIATRDKCYDFYRDAGLTPGAAPTVVPGLTQVDRAGLMAEKAAYCKSVAPRLGCPVDPSEPNWVKRNQMCNAVSGCERTCGDTALSARLRAGGSLNRDVMALKACEENHDFLKSNTGAPAGRKR